MLYDTYGIDGNIEHPNKDSEKEARSDLISKKRKELEDIAYDALDVVIDEILLSPKESDKNNRKTVLDKTNEVVGKIIMDSKRNLSLTDRKKVVTIAPDGGEKYISMGLYD